MAYEEYSGSIGDVITIVLNPETNSRHPDLRKSTCKWSIVSGTASAINLTGVQEKAKVTILSSFSGTIRIRCQYQICNLNDLSSSFENKTAYFDIKYKNGGGGGGGGGGGSGDATIICNTVEGIQMVFTKNSDGTCYTGIGDNGTAVSPSTTGTVTIPGYVQGYTVTAVGVSSFKGCEQITKVIIPNTVEGIYNAAFWKCGLKEIEIGNGVTKVDDYTFWECNNLKAIVFPSSLKTLNRCAISDCPALKEITLPSSLKTIKEWAIKGCSALEKITCLSSTPLSLSSDPVTSSIYNTATLYVPKGSLSLYRNAPYWGKFQTIKEIGGGESTPKLTLSASPSGGSVEKGTKVTLTAKADGSTVSGADIFYTTNGSTPSKSSTKYTSSGIIINETCTLKAKAFKSGYEDSDEMREVYTINQTPSNPTGSIKQVSAGGLHSLILKTDGTLWACGDNKYGQLGDGTTTNRSTPVKVMDGVSVISGGGYHSLILKTDGSLWACGNNYKAQLGTWYDGLNDICTPVKAMDGVSAISGGSYFSLILKTDGTLWTCGDNFNGQLGNGTTTMLGSSVNQVMDGVKAIAAGSDHSLILKNDGTLWACGWNLYGQLGDGTTTNRCTPVKVMGGVKAIAAGDAHSLILKTDETLWVCGCNDDGQLGDGTTTDRSTPVKVMGGVFSISGGYNHSLILKTNGTLWACGSNEKGQFGDGTTTGRSTPVKVMDGVPQVQNVILSPTGYATFYFSESAYNLPSGLSAQVVTNASNNKLTYKTIADGSVSGVVPKGTAVMLASDNKSSGTYTLTPTESSTTYNGTNLLRGSDDATTTTGDGYHYKLSYGKSGSSLSNVFGWYWGAQNGGSFQIEGHKAWLVVPKSAASTRGFTAEGDATDIAEFNAEDGEAVYYDLQGRRVEKPTKKGVYIKNGKKITIK